MAVFSYSPSWPIRGQSRINRNLSTLLYSFSLRIMKNSKNCYEYTRFRKKPARGDRFIKKESNILDYNAWDDVKWDEQQEQQAKESVSKNSVVTLTDDEIKKYDKESNQFWNSFYNIHENRFFKDRHWLFTEFPELTLNKIDIAIPKRIYPVANNVIDHPSASVSVSELYPVNNAITCPENNQNEKLKLFEIGCGVGNTIFPILKYNQNSDNLQIYGCDFSSKAIDILKENVEFNSAKCTAFVLDVTNDEWIVPFSENSLDIIVLIFVLSAIHPNKMQHVITKCYKYLKPNGLILLRDYGRYDLAQLRFKPGKCLQENFYVRGDGTRVYFFTQEEITDLFETAGFKQVQNLVDRRLQINRGKMLKMYRVWIQTKFRK